jgi:hypothetical protein
LVAKNILDKIGYKLVLNQTSPLQVYNATPDDAVFGGHVTDSNGDTISELIYIKLAAKTSKINPFPYAHNIENYMKGHPIFPHESTVDIFYSPEQFRAYRDLGYELGSRVRIDRSTSSVNIHPSQLCLTC